MSRCTYQITSHFTVEEMVQDCDLRKAPTCWGNTTAYDGINLIYAAGNNHDILKHMRLLIARSLPCPKLPFNGVVQCRHRNATLST